MRYVVYLMTVALLLLPACRRDATPRLSPEARAELEAIREKMDIAEPDPRDHESIARARKALDTVTRDYGLWRRAHVRSDDGCQFDCLAEWMLCIGEILPDGGLGHTPPDWEEFCEWKFNKCIRMCLIATDLPE